MAPLPSERVNRALPFTNIGVDYFGPHRIFYEGQEHKVWGCLYVCFVTRAVHLEAVYNLTSLSFIKTFRRFIARRTRPDIIWSDNSKTFKAGASAIVEAWNRILAEAAKNAYFSDQKITWKFIPELSPFFGGAYERMVALVKEALRHAIGRKRLNSEDYETFLTEAEALVNSRPLTYIHEDFESFAVLRPCDFWSPKALPGSPPLDSEENDPDYKIPKLETREELIRAWGKSNTSIERFWGYYYNHYLKNLREHQRLAHQHPRSSVNRRPNIGEMVQMQQEMVPKGVWPLARIKNILKSQDGEIRAAEVQGANGKTYRRSINQLYPMEISSDTRELEDNEPQPKEVPKIKSFESENRVGVTTRSMKARKTAVLTVADNFKCLNLPILIATIGILLAPIVLSKHCNPNVYRELETATHCTENGINIWRIVKDDTFCWDLCTGPNNNCFIHCKCPEGSEGCSFYTGPQTKLSNITRPEVAEALKKVALKNCTSCSDEFFMRNVTLVHLYDNTYHYVTNPIILIEELVDEYKCIGDDTIATGSSLFCKKYSCNSNAKKFCYLEQPSIAYLKIGSEKIPIADWGKREVKIFDEKIEMFPETCETCEVSCNENIVSIHVGEENITLLEIESQGDLQHIPFPSNSNFSINDGSSDFKIGWKFWRNGRVVSQNQIECSVTHYCEKIKDTCHYCILTLLTTIFSTNDTFSMICVRRVLSNLTLLTS